MYKKGESLKTLSSFIMAMFVTFYHLAADFSLTPTSLDFYLLSA